MEQLLSPTENNRQLAGACLVCSVYRAKEAKHTPVNLATQGKQLGPNVVANRSDA